MSFDYSRITPITRLAAFEPVFRQLAQHDPVISDSISQSLKNQLAPLHWELEQVSTPPLRQENLLLREAMLTGEMAAAYRRSREQQNERVAELWRFAAAANERFFNDTFDALKAYFEDRKQAILRVLADDTAWYGSLRDAARKSGVVVNWLLDRADSLSTRTTGKAILGEERRVEDRTKLEQILEEHLGKERVGADISRILDQVRADIRMAWIEAVRNHTPPHLSLPTLDLAASDGFLRPGYQPGVAEQALGLGIATSVVGTVGLAAGWHTISYALIHVFPPMAVFTLIITVSLSLITREKRAAARRKQVDEIVSQLFRCAVTQVETAPIAELEGLTLRQYIAGKSERIVLEAARQWWQKIWGGLSPADVEALLRAFEQHQALVQVALAGRG